MKAKSKAILAVLAASVVSMAPLAQAGSVDNFPVIPKAEQQKTRAEVKQELNEARQHGMLSSNDSNYPMKVQKPQSKSREQVKQELKQSLNNGEKKELERFYRG
ncbi:DUF4148 domain-containing protein [Oxalicibacterium faecigallinarum]|uniref:DUF4148 domain-containing protein n=1 Tax=Oxalicibacterium faecigallinarum TaxID=573741 RepID=A0A8J3F4P9_9BURK|nr:DUF4148 domain-containing protein [Oxalicibacterium faecigallinarum]GGI17001.1 hypothetical protein GCM10008066_06780 [Oxalicibacterium faecigallinarum]